MCKPRIMSTIDQLRTALPIARKGAHMLFLPDPFENLLNGGWATFFITHLLYRDKTIEADRLAGMPRRPDARYLLRYDYIFTTEQERLALVSPLHVSSRR